MKNFILLMIGLVFLALITVSVLYPTVEGYDVKIVEAGEDRVSLKDLEWDLHSEDPEKKQQPRRNRDVAIGSVNMCVFDGDYWIPILSPKEAEEYPTPMTVDEVFELESIQALFRGGEGDGSDEAESEIYIGNENLTDTKQEEVK